MVLSAEKEHAPIRGQFKWSKLEPCRRIAGLALAGALVACRSGDASEAGVLTRRDSAGITILRNESPALDESRAWSLAAVPELVIGREDDSTQQLYRVRGAARLEGDRLVVANAGAFEIRIYSPSGELVRKFGRKGAGPGEFSFLDGIWSLPGDSILAWDGDRQQMQLFDRSGQYERTITFEVQLGGRPRRYANSEFLGLIGVHDTLPRSLNETWWESYTFLRFNSHGDSLGSIGPLRAMEYMATDWQGSQLRAQRPLGHAAAFAVGPGAFYYGDSDGYRILVFDPSGPLKFVVERAAEPHAITADVRAAYIRERLEAGDNPQLRAEWEDYFAKVPFPQTAPAYRRFDVDFDGNLWVENWSVPGSAGITWSVFSPTGRWLTDVSGPHGQPQEIGADYMVLLQRNELGAEQVAVYGIVKPTTTK